jgi:general secretion pathway protein G
MTNEEEIMKRLSRAQSGFTLIEILVVLIIIGFLTAAVAVNYMGRIDEGARTKVKADLRSIEQGLNLYRLDKYRYPTTEEGLDILVPEYISKLTSDPWNRDYLYSSPGEHGLEFDIYTLGRDGTQGGEGIDMDLGNWNIDTIKE